MQSTMLLGSLRSAVQTMPRGLLNARMMVSSDSH